MNIFGKNINLRPRVRAAKVTVVDRNGNDITDANAEAYMKTELQNLRRSLGQIDKGIDEITGINYRVYTITDWLNAMRQADQPHNSRYQSSWVQLFDIFSNMVQDAHVQGAIGTLSEGLKSKDFYISDKDGNKLKDVTELFKSKWYYDYLGAILNSHLWGFGLVQLENFDPGELSIDMHEVNRKHVRPDLSGIVKNEHDQKAFKFWSKQPYKSWTVYLYNRNLGLLNACVRWWIYKTEVARFWAKYNQMYGIPPVIATTSIKDAARKTNAIAMLKNWITSHWMVIDENDKVEAFNNNGGSTGQQYFENLMRFSDEQISKALLHSIMTIDSGSSRSQSETHADITSIVIKSLARSAKFSTDKDLIPRLIIIGFPIPEGARLIWEDGEKMTMIQRAEILTNISANFSVSTEVASEFLGLELEEKEEAEPLPNVVKGALKDYKERFKDVT